jgi:tRNA pseudouridine55 synthase
LDGVINFYKPVGMSSAHAVHRVRKLTGQRKSGHAGTLDPLAEGTLVICLGRATKLVEAIMEQPKVYRTTAALDITSASFDRERPAIPVPVAEVPSSERVSAALASFEGNIQQVPPASSALKVRGRPAYQLERAGRSPVLRAREVQIHWVHVHAYDWPLVDFEVACGRGTYIRALVRDLGQRLGTGGCMMGLVRTAVGPFTSAEGWSPERLADTVDRASAIISLVEARALLEVRPIRVPTRP